MNKNKNKKNKNSINKKEIIIKSITIIAIIVVITIVYNFINNLDSLNVTIEEHEFFRYFLGDKIEYSGSLKMTRKDDITELVTEEGAILLDIRSPQEYEEGHLKKSISIPEYELIIRIHEVVANKKQIIIVYCGTGARSKKAQKILNKMGYEQVYNLYQGLENY